MPGPLFADQLVFHAPYDLGIERAPLPPPAPGEALVRTVVSAISPGTELLFYRGEAPGGLPADATIGALQQSTAYPLRYGYACVGRVAEVGPEVDPAWRGRLVFAFQPHASAFVAPVQDLLPVPEGIEADAAAFLPTMETAVTFVMDGAPLIGERVAVFGAGIVGLLTTALLARFPLADLAVVERIASRRTHALRLGAQRALDPAEAAALRDCDLVFEVTGSPAALDAAVQAAGFDARVIVGSWYGTRPATLDLGGHFHRSRMRLISSQVSTLAPARTGRWDKARRFALAWEMIRHMQPAALTTHRFPFREAAHVYQTLDQRPADVLHVVLTYEDAPGE
jgi:2-desacetyl-2-hydroxyethyl bacteriochlorophyllide A dehydrogenase